jgi:heat shock protein HslJ
MLRVLVFGALLLLQLAALAQNKNQRVFSGSLPSPDCDGLKTQLILKENFQFEISCFNKCSSGPLQTMLGTFREEKNKSIVLFRQNDSLWVFRQTAQGLIPRFKKDGGWTEDSTRFFLQAKPGAQSIQDKLANGIWQIRKINGKEFNAYSFEGEIPSMQFHFEDSIIEGNGGCNDYSASFKLNDKEFNISKDIQSTRMFCENSAEKIYFDLLRKVIRFELLENALIFTCADGGKLEFFLKGN